jgi:type I restriction enzyme S subunit
MNEMAWPRARLAAVAATKRWALNGGPFGSKLSRKHYVESGVPVIRGTNISGSSRFSFDDFVYVSQQKADELLANNAHPGDLVFTQRGTIGQVGLIPLKSMIPRFVISQSQMKLTPDPAQVDAVFLYYFFTDAGTVQAIRNLAFAAGVPHINLAILREFQVPVPPLPVQRRIAGILAGYDDLIENGRRRIRILLDVARTIYREWFVEFRFPDSKDSHRTASPLGPVPHGWEVRSIGEVAEVFRGRSYRSVDLLEEGGVPFLNLKCIDRGGGFRRSGLKRYAGEFGEEHIARKGDIVVAVTDMTQERRIVAHAAWVPTLDHDFGVFSMDLVRVQPKPTLPPPFLYAFLRFSGFADEVKQHANGANVLHLSPERIREYRLVVPPPELMRRFADVVGPKLALIDALENEAANLRHTRDLLLPRLIGPKGPAA